MSAFSDKLDSVIAEVATLLADKDCAPVRNELLACETKLKLTRDKVPHLPEAEKAAVEDYDKQ